MTHSKKRKKRSSSGTSKPNPKQSKMDPPEQPTPELKEKPVVTLPSDNASIGVWGKFLYEQMNHNYTQLKNTLDANIIETKEATAVIGKISASVSKLIQENRLLKEQNTNLNEKLLKLEYHQRRNNLLFDGFEEVYGETDTDCYSKVRLAIADLYEDDPEIDGEPVPTAYEKAGKITVNRIHRDGPYTRGRKRPIIVNFQWFGDVRFILENKKKLPTDIYVNEDFPIEIRQRRRVLRPILKKALSLSRYKGKVKLKFDKLIVNGIPYSMGNLRDLPKDLCPSDNCQEENDDYIGFLGLHSPFSNFYQCSFKLNNVSYSNVEQVIQADKATSCNDDRAKFKIMSTKNPFEMKRIGRNLQGFNEQKWEKDQSAKVVYNAVMAKFSQDHELLNILLRTGSKCIFKASTDQYWGCGLHLCNPNLLKKDSWVNPSGGLMCTTYT